ncbi:hypothetical protein R3P38DRAFT_3228281 [Favolaschia claudopus]|uniref:Uncharacterized protein n=1 Tax=Favolaschia claudopus TaxID=2862362 RepID=A0AAV9ZRW7_9AGAR
MSSFDFSSPDSPREKDGDGHKNVPKAQIALAKMLSALRRPVPFKYSSLGDKGLFDSESTHISTGVDKLHAKGITWKGIKIGM